MCNRNIRHHINPLPNFRLTPTPTPSITSTRGPLSRRKFLPEHEELDYLINTQDDDDPRAWVNPNEQPTGLTVRYGYINDDNIPVMLDPVNGWHQDGFPDKPTHVPHLITEFGQWAINPDFDAEVLINSEGHALWCDYDSTRLQRRFEFENYLKANERPTRCRMGLDGVARFDTLGSTTPDERIAMAEHLRDALCDGDAPRPRPIDGTIAATFHPSELDVAIAHEIQRTYDPDPFRNEFFDWDLHDHHMLQPSQEEIQDAIAEQDPAYGSWDTDENGEWVYVLDPTKRQFIIRNHHNCQEHGPWCEIAARGNSLTITRNTGTGSISVRDFRMEIDAPDTTQDIRIHTIHTRKSA